MNLELNVHPDSLSQPLWILAHGMELAGQPPSVVGYEELVQVVCKLRYPPERDSTSLTFTLAVHLV